MYSHVQYCLPVFDHPRLTNEESTNGHMKVLQVNLNNGLRNALAMRKSNRVSVFDLHEKANAKTLNHLSIQAILKLVGSIMDNKCDGLNAFLEVNKIEYEKFTRSQANDKLKQTKTVECFRKLSVKIWNCYKDGPVKTIEEFLETLPQN